MLPWPDVPAAKGDTLCRSIAQLHAIHLTPSQGPPSIVLFFKNIWTRDRRARRCHRQHRWQNLGPEYDYLLKNLLGQLRELSPNRSLEWPLTLAGDAPSEPFIILRQSPQRGPQAKSASGLHFGVSFRRSPIKTRHRAFFALAELQAENWEHLWSHDAILQ